MTFSLSTLSSDLKVPIVFVTRLSYTIQQEGTSAFPLLIYISSVKNGIVFPSFHIFVLVEGQKKTRILYV